MCADIVNIDEERVAAVGTAVYMAFKHLPKEERAASTCKLTPPPIVRAADPSDQELHVRTRRQGVGVTGLVAPAMQVEIECTAIIPEAAKL